MSNTEETNDLINFELSPLCSCSSTVTASPLISDNLLDSELPELEHQLQNAPATNQIDTSFTVDIGEILISIDDDYKPAKSSDLPTDSVDSPSKAEGDGEDLEALEILNGLDEVLNAHLESNFHCCEEKCDCLDAETQRSIEDCLSDLDNYLKDLDSSFENDGSSMDDTQSSSAQLSVSSASSNDAEKSPIENRKNLRAKLRKIEENYARYLSSAGARDSCDRATRSLSARCARRPVRTNTLPTLPDRRRARLPVRVPYERKEGAVNCSEPSTCAGTVAVETQTSVDPEVPKEHDVQRTDSLWLRSSMRRLRHLTLPIDSMSGDSDLPLPDVVATNVLSRISEVPSEALRPTSAPSRLSREGSVLSADNRDSESLGAEGRGSSASSRSRRGESLSSTSDSSFESSVETPGTASTGFNQRGGQQGDNVRTCENVRHSDMPQAESPLGQWPHSLSSTLACLSCSLGLFNISRFAILSIHFGSNFILQFVIMSLVLGLPLFTLQMCLGQQLGAGVIDMWRISPLFQGVGVSLFLGQALMGIYSIIGVSWVFVFFRDSFITRNDKYRWAEPSLYFYINGKRQYNQSRGLSQTIPDYFNGVVLHRDHLTSENGISSIKFQLAFNLAVVWMIVFISLSKGLKSYGKVIYFFTIVPVFGIFLLSAKIVGMMPPNYISNVLPEINWDEFFLNSKSWLAASQEAFLTWGLLGAAVMQITSHNKHKHLLQKDSSLVVLITFIVLFLVAFLANTCVQILRADGYNYITSSYENLDSSIFLKQTTDLPVSLANSPEKYMLHNSYTVGHKVIRPFVDRNTESGYQVLRLATELIPAMFAILGPERLSSFWAVLFYFILILFGIAQQLAIWHCVITGIMAIRAKILKSWETTITFFSCSFGFLLGLPMATEWGIYLVYFMDYTVGGIWWLLIVILLQIVAVFVVRGRPYSGDALVTALFRPRGIPSTIGCFPLLLSFVWNVILPVALVILCLSTFKNGNYREMFVWHHAPVVEYWPLWARQIGSLLQLLPIILIPLVAVIQSYRYLNNGPEDILDRIQLLYRPPLGDHMDEFAIQEAAAAGRLNNSRNAATILAEDPPPKYTPPPSYTTATGARIAKFLRQSIRRSVRRIASVLGEPSNIRHRNAIPQTLPPPPDYSAVLVEMNQRGNPPTSVTDGVASVRISTLERLRMLQPNPGSSHITAAEVASILRSSFRRSTVRRGNIVRNEDSNFPSNSITSISAENLIDSAAPIGETSLVLDLSSCENGLSKNTTVI